MQRIDAAANAQHSTCGGSLGGHALKAAEGTSGSTLSASRHRAAIATPSAYGVTLQKRRTECRVLHRVNREPCSNIDVRVYAIVGPTSGGTKAARNRL
eukprot:m.220532 g.220532  ORF g.220532 m.220532 type:complete len:98 (-) comp19167_c2_seq3:1839-2132(-)